MQAKGGDATDRGQPSDQIRRATRVTARPKLLHGRPRRLCEADQRGKGERHRAEGEAAPSPSRPLPGKRLDGPRRQLRQTEAGRQRQQQDRRKTNRYSLWLISECETRMTSAATRGCGSGARRSARGGRPRRRRPLPNNPSRDRHSRAKGRRRCPRRRRRRRSPQIPPGRREGRSPGHGVEGAARQDGDRRPAEQRRQAAAVGRRRPAKP